MRKKQKNKANEFEFDPVTHIGKVNGETWPSVTQLLQEERLIDYSSVPVDRLEYKRLIGIRVHAASLMLDNGNLDEQHFNESFPECVPFLEAYRKFRLVENFEPERKENRYFSLKWKFHGQPDEQGIHITNFGNDISLVDYKCTWRMYEATGPQLSGYELLINECLGIKIKKRFGLLLKPSGNFDLIPFKDPVDMIDFKTCVHLHWRRRNHYKTQKGVFSHDTNPIIT